MSDREERSDEELMAAYVGGDPAAFRQLFERYAPVLLRVMRRQLPTGEDAEDVVQQTFLQLHRARRDFRGGSRFRPWLFTIAFNLRHEHYRRLGRRSEVALTAPAASLLAEQPRVATKLVVQDALARLPAEQQEAIRLHWFEGFSFQEIAHLVGASVTAVKVRAHRGYQQLRRVLGAGAGNRIRPATVTQRGKSK